MKKLVIVICLLGFAFSAIATESSYTPMIVDGKSWIYGIYSANDGGYSEECPDHQAVYKLEGTTKIDGVEYHVLNEYVDGELNPNNPIGYFREDIDTKKVWYLMNNDFESVIFGLEHPGDCRHGHNGEVLLYDFGEHPQCALYQWDDTYWNAVKPATFEYNGNTLNGFNVQNYSVGPIYVIEGVGYQDANQVEIDNGRIALWPSSILGSVDSYIMGRHFTIPNYYPFLQSVMLPDGTELYGFDINKAGCESVVNDVTKVVISEGKGAISISSAKRLGDVAIYNVAGAKVCGYYVPTTEMTVNLAPGAYIVTVGNYSNKALVK